MAEIISLENLFLLGNKDVKTNVKMAEQGLAMKILHSNEIKSIKKEDILRVELYRSTRNYAMRLITKNNIIEFNNILEEMVEEIRQSVSDWYSLSVYVKPLEVTNTTKGEVSFSNECLEYRKEKLIFDIPLKDIISVCSVKNEVVLGFEAEDSTEGVTEMRLTVPDENFVNNLRERSESGQSKAIFTFEEMNNISPRGKSDYIFNFNCLRIIGRTFEHKVLFSSIKRVIKIIGEKNVNIIIEVNPPIKQGLTRYEFINTQFEKDIEEEFKIDIDEKTRKLFPEIENIYTGELFKTFITAMEIFTKKPVESLSNFKSKHGFDFVTCNFKATEASLYFVNDGILILPKVVFLPFTKIRSVKFSRVDVSVSSSKMFDMKINTLDHQYQLSALEKDEFNVLEVYLSQNGVEISIDIIEHHISDDESDSTTDIDNLGSESESSQSEEQ
ncbi:Nucleosome-binding factor SPN, POB3 subunit [Pseudoloma neurophilia]|uniref:FACT complex subunit POB3 n=1 Tax=Pseudoloma neurophilia TaxID=146866 RepID=A0A0R0M0K1_9MICR|nr:Nucleosome-binding factor SPN, POB3 subunit [Pseudoloma neurophilia]